MFLIPRNVPYLHNISYGYSGRLYLTLFGFIVLVVTATET